jgi:diguanylate cyclase (GGDEF)-like protein
MSSGLPRLLETDGGTPAPAATSTAGVRIAAEREVQALRRDEKARRRDESAAARDDAADRADRAATGLAEGLGDVEERIQIALAAAALARGRATEARATAAADRRQAARDREAAALDRLHLEAELHRAQFDDLTGAFRRGIGEVLIGHELERGRRAGDPLHLAFVDVDDLKGTNDSRGHGAGDDVLRCLHAGFRARLRPYDPIIRWGGDEFVCLFPAVDAADARARIEAARVDLRLLDPPVSITFGISSREDGDSVDALVGRADAALMAARGRSGRG